jgi:uncharacterized membrane protein YphA (DoxX/SURF4 family)
MFGFDFPTGTGKDFAMRRSRRRSPSARGRDPPYAAEAIAPLIANGPVMRWLGVFGERGEAKIIGTIELTAAAVLIIGSVIPMASAVGAAMACVTFPHNHVVRFQHARDHSEKLDRFPDHLDVPRAVSAEGHCAARRVLYAASRIFVAVTCASWKIRRSQLLNASRFGDLR